MRVGRAVDSGERAGIVDHAGQSQSDPVRGNDDGLRAGTRRNGCSWIRRIAGQLRTQRVQASDHLQLFALGHFDHRRVSRIRRVHGQGDRGRSRKGGLVRQEFADAGNGARSQGGI